MAGKRHEGAQQVQDTPLETMQKYLEGIVYPTKREMVLDMAQGRGAPADVLERLSALRSRVAGPHEVLIVLREGGWTVRDTKIRQGAPH